MAAMLLPRLLLLNTIDRSERILIIANGDRCYGLCTAVYLNYTFFFFLIVQTKT
jgi:hypothetical protein